MSGESEVAIVRAHLTDDLCTALSKVLVSTQDSDRMLDDALSALEAGDLDVVREFIERTVDAHAKLRSSVRTIVNRSDDRPDAPHHES